MLILYTKDHCKYCDKVKTVFEQRRIVYEDRNIKNAQFLNEARMHGAKTMPYLFDTASNVGIQESDDIIDYASEYSF